MAIGTAYTIRFTDSTLPGKIAFNIQPGTTDGPLTPITASPDSTASNYHTSVVLPGMGIVLYGERVAQTLVHMLEHFASATPPVAPTIGQLWYDYGNAVLKVWDGNIWAYTGAQWVEAASALEYNELANMINQVIGTPTSTGTVTSPLAYGYNQTPLPLLDTSSNLNKPTPALWLAAYNMLNKIASHQGTTLVNTLTPSDFRLYSNGSAQNYGMKFLLRWFDQYEAAATLLTTNRFNVSAATLETSLPTNGSSARTASWVSSLNHTLTYTFTSAAHMRSFFNTGGTINVTPAMSDQSTVPNKNWYTTLASLGTIKVGAFSTSNGTVSNPVGYYNVQPTGVETVCYTVLRQNTSTNTVDTTTGFRIFITRNETNFTLTVRVNFQNGIPSADTLYMYDTFGTVTGTISCSQTVTKVSNLNINSPAIAVPTATAITLMSQGGTTTAVIKS